MQRPSPHAGRERNGRHHDAGERRIFLPADNKCSDSFAIPANELFDSRTNYSESQVDLTWQKTARLSFEVGARRLRRAQGFAALAGLNGYSAQAGARVPADAPSDHGLRHFSNLQISTSSGLFGNAQLRNCRDRLFHRLNRNMDLTLQAGGSRVDTRGLTDVSLDPAIAAIVGQNVAVVTFSRVVVLPACRPSSRNGSSRILHRLAFRAASRPEMASISRHGKLRPRPDSPILARIDRSAECRLQPAYHARPNLPLYTTSRPAER